MSAPLLIRNIGQLLTLRGANAPRRGAELRKLGIVTDGAVLIDAGKIVHAGRAMDVESLNEARDARELDACGCVVMPGFVDSHTHLVFGPPRLLDFEMRLAGADYHAISEAGGGIRESMRALRSLSADQLSAQAQRHLADFARFGTTTLEAKSGYALDEANECKTLELLRALDGNPLRIVPTYLGAHVTPPEFETESDRYIDWMIRHMLPMLRERRLARFVDVYCDGGAFTRPQARRYLEAARALGFGLRIHAEQFANTGAARLACELGAASADHLEQATETDAIALGRSSTVATLLPGSVFHLALGRYAPARTLIEAGAAVALATDFNPGTSPTVSMPMVIALACRMMGMTPAEAITAATVNGAFALGLLESIGTLEPGKDADLILLDAEDFRELAYWFGANPVHMTLRGGRVIYTRGSVATTKVATTEDDARNKMENELSTSSMPKDPLWPSAGDWLAGHRALYAQRKLAVLGVPTGLGSITPGRCDLAPAAVREALFRFSTYDLEHGDDLESVAALDRGDLAVEQFGVDEAFQPIADGVRGAAKGVDALILLGGDNSITRPGVHGMDVALERCGLLTFDAHLDLRDLDAGLTNGNPVRALLRDGLPGRNIVQVGLQPFANSRQYHEVALDAGITLATSEECHRRGIEAVTERALAQLAQNCDAIYVDFDIDVLDRAFAPACPGARPGGITPAALRSAARLCGEHPKVRVADLVEVDPECDVAHVTVYATCMCLLGFASGVARSRHL